MQPRVASQSIINVIEKRIFSKIEEHFLNRIFPLKKRNSPVRK